MHRTPYLPYHTSMKTVYLDWAATAVPDPDILTALRETALRVYANPSSKHGPGREASLLLEECRRRCAGALKTPEKSIIFTSGGTESNNMIVFSLLNRQSKGRILISGLEHPSCAEPVAKMERFGWGVDTVAPDSRGIITGEAVEARLKPDTHMVVVMAVHNETGAIQPVEDIVRRVRAYEQQGGRRIHIHCDAVQAFGKIPFEPAALGVDSAVLSAHKISGPRGIGLLYCRTEPEFLFRGGGQEGGRRHGTENLPAIYGMTLAVEKALAGLEERSSHAESLKARLFENLKVLKGFTPVPSGADILPEHFSPFILSLSKPPIPGEVMVRMLSDAGFAVSTGSACSSREKKHSALSQIPGIDRGIAQSVIRVSTGPSTTVRDIDNFCSALEQLRV